ncbi:hypothetical protein DLJ49_13020 [Rhodovulum sp. 12E13]|uniref:hypothetical protein n=1 Tax=Rhodovulum sp. 12E13 TaxID=2203891 RepID=UPI000E1AD310|nr:hypothetical protein [Rhodovulum sp. 12E13]RDC71777.1 hypothetical protein DLJ49_13020 [Rhodovulum sp. 12E13]
MRARLVFCAALVALSGPAAAQGVLEDSAASGALLTGACVPDTLDFPALFEAAKAGAMEAGLPAAMDSDEAAMFGDPGGAHLMVARTVDSLACRLTLPAPAGSQEYYAALRAEIEAAVAAVYPDALSVEADTPSPHEDKHEWVFRVPAERHFAATLTWQVEDGVTLGIGYRQIYD